MKRAIKEYGITQKEFAARAGIQASHLSEAVRGRRAITSRLAEHVVTVLGGTPDKWVKLQAEYDAQCDSLFIADKAEAQAKGIIAEYNDVYDMHTIFRYTDMVNNSAVQRLAFCSEELHFDTPIAEVHRVGAMFHKSERTGLDERMIATWTVVARYEAEHTAKPTGTFRREEIDRLARELSNVFHNNTNTINRTARLLSAYGIGFCIVPKVKRASVDGCTFFAQGVPYIVVTLRFNRIDNFAFAILHEIAHLKLHFADTSKAITNVNIPRSSDTVLRTVEREANDYAAKMLIPAQLWTMQPSVQLMPTEIQRTYSKWAEQHGLNKWIVLGRLSYETGIYAFSKDDTRTIN